MHHSYPLLGHSEEGGEISRGLWDEKVLHGCFQGGIQGGSGGKDPSPSPFWGSPKSISGGMSCAMCNVLAILMLLYLGEIAQDKKKEKYSLHVGEGRGHNLRSIETFEVTCTKR